MKYLIYFVVIILLVGINAGMFSYLKIAGAAPNLVFLLVIFFALDKENYDFIFLAFCGGLFLDFFSGGPFGGFTLILLLTGFLLRLLANRLLISETNWKYLAAVLAGVVFISGVILKLYGVAVFKLGWPGQYPDFQIFSSRFFPEYLYNLLLMYPVYRLAKFLKYIDVNFLNRQRNMV